MERDDSSSMTALMAFVIGAAAGVALGLLLAPKAGEEMRQTIKDVSRDAMDKTRETAEMMQEKARSMMNRGKSAAEEGMDMVREKAQEFRGTREERTENIVDPFRNKM
ncbi:YtxH domain-containing protein [Geomonas sp. RF6]|uniref:YtxH domain-containing protein n=1 Tax=Geomonas sp. RF6 TaxID=2897342 RepID=UPI001E4E8A09|nr:YtxH domain-containing protein [Geomonas sp. RF6]UFS69383.1 YtxH domain-containing protein [Geomonas sp. RF6]